MRFDQIWDQLCKKRSALADPDAKAEFTSSDLRQLLRQVYEQGEKHGKETAGASVASGVGAFDPLDDFKRGMGL